MPGLNLAPTTLATVKVFSTPFINKYLAYILS